MRLSAGRRRARNGDDVPTGTIDEFNAELSAEANRLGLPPEDWLPAVEAVVRRWHEKGKPLRVLPLPRPLHQVPCEICGETVDLDGRVFRSARPGSAAEALGLDEESICMTCDEDRPALVERWREAPLGNFTVADDGAVKVTLPARG